MPSIEHTVTKDITLILGDSEETMTNMDNNSVDLFLTDPPYKDYQSNRTKKKTAKIHANKFSPKTLTDHISRLLKPGHHFYIFCDHLTFSSFFDEIAANKELVYKNMIVWVKNNHGSGDLRGNYSPQHELIIYGTKGKGNKLNNRPSNIQCHKKVPNKRYNHSTIKPVELLTVLINASSNEDELVFDPYAGSFSTAHACMNTNRKSVSVEQILEHYTGGIQRLENVLQPKGASRGA